MKASERRSTGMATRATTAAEACGAAERGLATTGASAGSMVWRGRPAAETAARGALAMEAGRSAAWRLRRVRIEGVRRVGWALWVAVAASACGAEPEEQTTVSIGGGESGARVAQEGSGLAVKVASSPVPGTPGPVDPAVLPPSLKPDPIAHANVTYGDAERVFRSGDYRTAAAMFEAYAARMPTNPWGHYMLGISAWRDGDHARAEAALRRTLEVDAEHRKGLINLARVLLEQRRASDALDVALKVVDLEPELGEGWRVLGNAHAELGMVDDAEGAYMRALVLNDGDAWTMNNLGLLRIESGRHEEALGPLARAAELGPDVATFQNNLGVALERAGWVAQAGDAFRAVLALDEGHEKAKVSLARVEGLLPTSKPVMTEVSELAEEFAGELERRREERRTAEGVRPE